MIDYTLTPMLLAGVICVMGGLLIMVLAHGPRLTTGVVAWVVTGLVMLFFGLALLIIESGRQADERILTPPPIILTPK